MSTLSGKSLTELRALAQGMGLNVVFSQTKENLMNAIDEHIYKQVKSQLPPPIVSSNVSVSHDLRVHPPARGVTQMAIMDALKSYVDKGLMVTFTSSETWHMSYRGRHDSGSQRVPLRVIINCAKDVMK